LQQDPLAQALIEMQERGADVRGQFDLAKALDCSILSLPSGE